MKRDPEPARRPDQTDEGVSNPAGSSLAKGFLDGPRGVSALEREALRELERQSEEEIERLRARIRSYERLVESARSLSSILDLDALLGAILQEVVELCHVDRGFLLLADGAGMLEIVNGYDIERGHLEISSETEVSRTLAREAYQEEKVRFVFDALQREEFRTLESIQALQLSTIVCVPLLTGQGAIGVLYLDSRRPETLSTSQDRAILEAFSSHAAVALENARLHRELLNAQAGLERENRDLRRAVPGSEGIGEIRGQSRIMEDLRHRIGQLQEVDSPVLILGESGTGKELVARAIHAGSPRTKERLQVVDCTAVPKDLMESELFGHKKGSFTGALQDKQGLLEAADGGTLFLDEIGDMPLALQSRLLRALESKEFRRVGETATRKVDVRILSATNRDLESMIRKGEFREDLFYRLKVVTLQVPALRERREDILPLAEYFLRQNLEARNREYTGFTAAAVPFLLSHPWPGNVRELKNTIEGACAFLQPGRPVGAEDLQLVAHQDRVRMVPPSLGADEPGLKEYKEDAERLALQEALEESTWVVSRAAKRLGISRQHLHNRIRHHGLQRPSPRRAKERA